MIHNRKRWRGGEVFTIRPKGWGPINIPGEWTNVGEPDDYQIPGLPRLLVTYDALVRVAELVDAIRSRSRKRS